MLVQFNSYCMQYVQNYVSNCLYFVITISLAGQVVSPQSAPACVENKNDVSRENSTVDFSKVRFSPSHLSNLLSYYQILPPILRGVDTIFCMHICFVSQPKLDIIIMLAFKFTCNVLPIRKIKCVDFTHSLQVSATWYDASLPVKKDN